MDTVSIVLMAFTGVGPIEDVNAPIGAVIEVNAAEPGIVEFHEIGLVFADSSGPSALEAFLVDAAAVEVEREESVFVLGGPTAALINHEAAVGVTAAKGIGTAAGIAGIGPFLAGVPMVMVSGLINEPIAERSEVLAVHSLVVCARNTLPEVTDDGVDEEELAVLIPVVPPGICAALADDLEEFFRGMITPDGAIQFCARAIRRARFADGGSRLDAMASVEPAVGPPFEAVQDIMTNDVVIPAVEQDFRRPVGNIIAVAIGDENEIRGAGSKYTTEAKRDAGELLSLVPKHLALIEMANAFGVFENKNAIVLVRIEVYLVIGIGIELGNPQAATVVKGHGDGLMDIRLGSEHCHLKARRHRNAAGCLSRWEGFIHDRGFIGKKGQEKSDCQDQHGDFEQEPEARGPGQDGAGIKRQVHLIKVTINST